LIQIERSRLKAEEIFNFPNKIVESYEALKVLAIHELGCGGDIISVSIGRGQVIIKIETRLNDNIDTVIFSGEVDDMEILMRFLAGYVAVSKITGLTASLPIILDENIIINSDLVVIIAGLDRVFSALIVLADLNSEDEVELAKSLVFHNNRILHSGLNELIEAIRYYFSSEVTFEEACQEIGGVEGLLEV